VTKHDPEVDAEYARMVAVLDLAQSMGPVRLAGKVLDLEAQVRELRREQLRGEVDVLAAALAPAPSERAAADRHTVIDGYRAAVRERDQLRRRLALAREQIARQRRDLLTGGPGVAAALLRFAELCSSLDAVIAAGRRGELSMPGLVPVTALVELLDAARPHLAADRDRGQGAAPYGAEGPGGGPAPSDREQ
jgi:hypothetical protein